MIGATRTIGEPARVTVDGGWMRPLYRTVVRVVRRLGPIVARGDSKIGRGLRGRASAHLVLADWGRPHRDPARPLAWFHAPSVGEGLQAQAVMEALRALRPDIQLAYTYFSPSAEGLARRIGADVATYLPWDLPEALDGPLATLRPDLLVFTKTEVWPELTVEAARRSIPVVIVGASVPEGSRRARRLARAFLRPTWGRVALACAIDQQDAARLVGLGVASAAAHVTGDPGIDSAVERASAADPAASYLAPFHAERRPTLVAGSTWPSDEDVLLPALGVARVATPRLRVVLAPHEPSAPRVGALLEAMRRTGWNATTLRTVEERGVVGDADAVLVDRVGVLAHLYTVGDVAYVGGGYHSHGLHTVLEPAAAGLPVVFGPRHANARAAGDLLAAGAAREASGGADLARALGSWLGDAAARKTAADRAIAYIGEHRGAAARTAALLAPLLDQTHGRRGS